MDRFESWPEAEIQHMWTSASGLRWCLLYLNGAPYLACELDA